MEVVSDRDGSFGLQRVRGESDVRNWGWGRLVGDDDGLSRAQA